MVKNPLSKVITDHMTKLEMGIFDHAVVIALDDDTQVSTFCRDTTIETGEGNRRRANLASIADRSNHVFRVPACRDTNNDVTRAEIRPQLTDRKSTRLNSVTFRSR